MRVRELLTQCTVLVRATAVGGLSPSPMVLKIKMWGVFHLPPSGHIGAGTAET